MSHPGDEGWMLGYSGFIIESKPAKQRKHWQRSQLNRHPNILPLPIDVSNRFPPELIDRIIDHLQGDRKALSSCSLVCKAWLASSRYQLFGNATVRIHNRNAPLFYKLLDAPSPIACYIRHLEITGGWFHRSSDSVHTFTLPRAFVSITSLRLINGHIYPVIETSLMDNLQALTELELYSCVFYSSTHFPASFEAFPLLQRLSLVDVNWHGEFFSVPDNRCPRRPLSHLRDLEFHRCNRISELLAWLLSFERVPAISHLKLDSTQAATLGRFLCALGPTLEHLTLSNVADHSQFYLSRNHHLRTVRLNHIVIDGDLQPSSVEWVTVLLSQIISRQLETITFHIVLSDPNALGILDWNALVQILARPQFAGLRKINFVVTCYKTKATSFIKEKLSTYNSGIVHVIQCQN